MPVLALAQGGGLSFANTMKDLSNALGSVAWHSFDNVVENCAERADWTLCKARYEDWVIEMKADEGTFYMKPSVGGMMGDPCVVSAFLGAFVRPMRFWAAGMEANQPGTSPLRGALPDDDAVDLSHCAYADDLHRAIPFTVGSTMQE
eukprot:4059544-Pyramimonas_sp.AAC.1